MSEQYSNNLKERIDRKMESTGEKRETQLQSIQERIREHVCSMSIYYITWCPVTERLCEWRSKSLVSVCV